MGIRIVSTNALRLSVFPAGGHGFHLIQIVAAEIEQAEIQYQHFIGFPFFPEVISPSVSFSGSSIPSCIRHGRTGTIFDVDGVA